MILSRMQVLRCETNEEYIHVVDEDGFTAPIYKKLTFNIIKKGQSDVFLVETEVTLENPIKISGKTYYIMAICPN